VTFLLFSIAVMLWFDMFHVPSCAILYNNQISVYIFILHIIFFLCNSVLIATDFHVKEIFWSNKLWISCADVRSKYVGDAESYLREIFRKARLAGKSIIFFDEVDSVAGKRLVTFFCMWAFYTLWYADSISRLVFNCFDIRKCILLNFLSWTAHWIGSCM
jgi:hypothetical protein